MINTFFFAVSNNLTEWKQNLTVSSAEITHRAVHEYTFPRKIFLLFDELIIFVPLELAEPLNNA